MIYDNLVKNTNTIREVQNKVHFHFVKGPFVEIKGSKSADYKIQFIDNKTGKIHFTSNIKNNCWCRCSIEYFVEWKIIIYENDKLWYETIYNATDKRVYIAFDSRALGDSLAWFPYVEEFRKKHNCKVITSTFMNDMFIGQYPDIEFVTPGSIVSDLYAMYSVGLFYNEDSSINGLKNPNNFREQTMQKMCSDILGIEYTEIKPKVKQRNINIDNDLKQVCIGVFGRLNQNFGIILLVGKMLLIG
jgi:autotransporter strand-loop-strand O-heptosyltransferase